jgi:pilus assembly protein CpaF
MTVLRRLNSPGLVLLESSSEPADWDEIIAQALRELADRSGVRQEPTPTDIEDALDEVTRTRTRPLTRAERGELLQRLMAEVGGLGPLEPLLEDDSVTEVMVNGCDRVFVEREGRIVPTRSRFRDEGHLMQIIERILAPLGRRVDESSPMVDARLPSGARVNVVVPPVAVHGPTLTIRKFSRNPFSMKDLVGFGTLGGDMAIFLEAAVEARLNIVVSGGTGSGKTTTLNALSGFIPGDQRIVTIEDAAELRLQQEHVVSLEARPANVEGRGQVTIRQLVINALRMRPDRIVVGEVRGGEALDMLQAMNTGHDGSLTTAHANTPRDLLSRLETMVLMAGTELPVRAIRQQVVAAVDLIVHQNRGRDGRRRVTHITEVTGMEGDTITLQDLFVYDDSQAPPGRPGVFRPTGIMPSMIDRLEHTGRQLRHLWRREGERP